jgi:hypothetical protein
MYLLLTNLFESIKLRIPEESELVGKPFDTDQDLPVVQSQKPYLTSGQEDLIHNKTSFEV